MGTKFAHAAPAAKMALEFLRGLTVKVVQKGRPAAKAAQRPREKAKQRAHRAPCSGSFSRPFTASSQAAFELLFRVDVGVGVEEEGLQVLFLFQTLDASAAAGGAADVQDHFGSFRVPQNSVSFWITT